MRRLYSFLLLVLLPVIFGRLYIKGRRNPMYRQRWKERLGIVPEIKKTDKKTIWIHAVSVGEVEATVPLVNQLFSEYSDSEIIDLRIIMTTTTPTGAETVERRYSDQIKHFYIPYDLVMFQQRFIDLIKPDLMIIMETEVWPNLIHVCRKNNIPMMLANARMSERSCRGYQRISSLSKPMFSSINIIAAQTDQDAKRIISLGANPDQVIITGSLKFDQTLPDDLENKSLKLRNQLGAKRPIWVAASTHDGEEEQVLEAHKQILQIIPDCLLILVPRHPERFDRVFGLCERFGFKTRRRSRDQNSDEQDYNNQIYLVDTMGDLLLCYGVADVAFVAGSLTEIGGHNLLEPASLGLPVLMGPYTFKIEKIFQTFFNAGAAFRINNAKELAEQILYFLGNEQERLSAGSKARELVNHHQGAAERHLEMIKKII